MREKMKKVYWSCERERWNKIGEWVGEYSSKLVSNFTHQNFLVKMVRLLGVIFLCFHQIGSPKNYFDETIRNALRQIK
jgi:hypothetical protein